MCYCCICDLRLIVQYSEYRVQYKQGHLPRRFGTVCEHRQLQRSSFRIRFFSLQAPSYIRARLFRARSKNLPPPCHCTGVYIRLFRIFLGTIVSHRCPSRITQFIRLLVLNCVVNPHFLIRGDICETPIKKASFSLTTEADLSYRRSEHSKH